MNIFLNNLKPEQRVANEIVGVLIPALKELLPKLDAQGGAWSANEITEKITDSIISKGGNFENAALGDYKVVDWLEWGVVFSAFKDFVDSYVTVTYPDLTTKTVKPRDFINKFYTPIVAE